MRKVLIICGAVGLAAMGLLAACASPPAGSPPPSANADLFTAEATFTGAVSLAGAYVNLAVCGQVASPKVCSDPAITAKIRLAVTEATTALGTAETLILGCPMAAYVGSTATPPTASCGVPVANQTAQQQALTALETAITALESAVPIITGSH